MAIGGLHAQSAHVIKANTISADGTVGLRLTSLAIATAAKQGAPVPLAALLLLLDL